MHRTKSVDVKGRLTSHSIAVMEGVKTLALYAFLLTTRCNLARDLIRSALDGGSLLSKVFQRSKSLLFLLPHLQTRTSALANPKAYLSICRVYVFTVFAV